MRQLWVKVIDRIFFFFRINIVNHNRCFYFFSSKGRWTIERRTNVFMVYLMECLKLRSSPFCFDGCRVDWTKAFINVIAWTTFNAIKRCSLLFLFQFFSRARKECARIFCGSNVRFLERKTFLKKPLKTRNILKLSFTGLECWLWVSFEFLLALHLFLNEFKSYFLTEILSNCSLLCLSIAFKLAE